MGEPISRLNPKVESSVQRVLLNQSVQLLLSIAMMLPFQEHNKRGVKPYDYRIILVLCILRILFRETYADYEILMRTDSRICVLLGLKILPGRSTIQRGMDLFSMELLREFNSILLKDLINRKLNIILDASGIRIHCRSIWYCLKIKKNILKRDCDKVHLAVCEDLLLILNWRITKWRKHDSPFLKKLLAPFKLIGLVFADKGYLSRKNFQFVYDKKGALFAPFKINSTASPKSHPAWKFAFNFWKKFNICYMNIYHQRSKIESVFSALKKRYGDKLYCKKARMRRKEMAMRFISYNIRIIICYKYSIENNLPLWVRAKKY